ncbi:hypothetical protein HDU76_002815, partial [Blyttiomyces sp. JEL0837]
VPGVNAPALAVTAFESAADRGQIEKPTVFIRHVSGHYDKPAAGDGRLEVVKILLERCRNIDFRGAGLTAAAAGGRLEVVKYLVTLPEVMVSRYVVMLILGGGIMIFRNMAEHGNLDLVN